MKPTGQTFRIGLLVALVMAVTGTPQLASSQAGTRAGVSTRSSTPGDDVQSSEARGTRSTREIDARGSRAGEEEYAEVEEQDRRDLTDDPDADSVEEHLEREDGEVQEEEGAEPKDLPGAQEGNSSVTPQAISLPEAEGSIQGMGESFSPGLSSGTATFSVPFALPAGRAGVQPSLGLSYSSSNGNSVVGIGWGMGAPFISRQTDRGLPRYDDRSVWHEEEDRFIYNGGQELVPVDSDAMAIVDASGLYDVSITAAVPDDVAGWQQYRARVEGGFMRFFRSPDGRRWVVQSKDGTRFDFGELPAMTGPPDLNSTFSLQSEQSSGRGRIFMWHLTRMSDAHGSTVYYQYAEHMGSVYLSDVFYLSPNSCADEARNPNVQRACRAPLSEYGARVAIAYADRPDAFSSYTTGWRTELRRRVRRVTVTMAETEVGVRYLVRRYHLTYDASVHHSLLASVQVEGRPHVQLDNAPAGVMTNTQVLEGALGDQVVGQLLPAMNFEYSQMPAGAAGGFGGVDNTVVNLGFGPDVSVDLADADLYDVNTDGLPDVIVTEPARYPTSDGRPAAGVFFNGFSGESTTPAGRAAVFSEPVAVPMRGDLSGIMRMRNANIVPMDVDGDGRGDLLHMPFGNRYGYFTPTRQADEAVNYSVRPAQQGWGFTYAEVELDRTDNDPRIDLALDGTHYKTWDVNNDHLVDVVRTTGTVMQTWMNLGWADGGEGRFGQATFDPTSGTWTLSTAPIETCVLQDGTPVDFSDPQVRLADMNGDGIEDILRIRRGRLVYWAGRGEALWGDGAATCPRGAGDNRQRPMQNAPPELNPTLSGVFVSDVNADGLSDVVQVRFNELDVWFNVNGERFTARQTFASPFAPAFSPNIRFADIDGSGTTDLVYGRAGQWKYMDLLGGVRPRLLTRVHNGLGATTTLTYASAAEDYTRDLVEADLCPGDCGGDEYQWSQVGPPRGKTLADPGPGSPQCPWGDQKLFELSGQCVYRSGGSPVLSSVVRSVSTTDNFDRLGRAANVQRTEFKYHEGYYEGIEQEFRGFGAADAVAVGDAHHGSQFVRTFFHQGRRPSELATDRLAENPYEALKGRQWYTETFDDNGAYLATAHATVVARNLITGLDGRVVWYAFVSRTDEFRYDHDQFEFAREERELPWLQFEGVDQDGDVVTNTAPYTWPVPVRSERFAHIGGTTDIVDNVGNVRQQTTLGRLQDEHDSAPNAYPDDLTVSHSVPALLPGGNWIWRTVESWATGANDGGLQLGHTTQSFDAATGDLQHTQARASLPAGTTFEFGGTADAQGYTLPSTQIVESSAEHDAWGNPVASCASANLHTGGRGDCLRYSEVTVDTEYAQLPASERIAVGGTTGASFCATSTRNAPFCLMQTRAAWDRGFGVLQTATDANGQVSSVAYDGLGRLSAVTPPAVEGCSMGNAPTQAFKYELNVGEQLPVHRITAFQNYGNADCSAAAHLESVSYVDGLGRARVALARRGSMEWERSGLAVLNARGTAYLGFQNDIWSGSSPSPSEALQVPNTPHSEAVYDAFGRATLVLAEDDSPTATYHGATSTTVCDALDLSSHPTFRGTCTTTRVDGQGRTIDQVLRQRRESQGNQLETYRLATTYRADGVAIFVARAETADDAPLSTGIDAVDNHVLVRTFTYDSLGRRVASTDPDSDSRASGATDANRTWRYLFNDVGDLAAVRDPRGCGQNFYYDLAGRLVAEDYVSCPEAMPAGDEPDAMLPADAIGMAMGDGAGQLVDARYFFDVEPDYDLDVATLSSHPHWVGRLSGATDRAQRSVVVYDQRGQPRAAARQMAVLPEARCASPTLDPDLTDTVPCEEADPVPRRWDEDHTYVSRTRYDYLGRPVAMDYPTDPDWLVMGGTGDAPEVGASLGYNQLGLPVGVTLAISQGNDTLYGVPIVRNVTYNANRQPVRTDFGDEQVIGPLFTEVTYDIRQRPVRSRAERQPGDGAVAPELNAVSVVHDFQYAWDEVSNLTEVTDARLSSEWPSGYRPWRQTISHDALYRVNRVEFTYMNAEGAFDPGYDDAATDWREERTRPNLDGSTHEQRDPMHQRPAPMVSQNASTRVRDLVYDYDWLANQTEWTDDQGVFYERSAGLLSSGNDDPGFSLGDQSRRPSALYLSTNIRATPASYDEGADHGGYVTLDYGDDGNVTRMTVRSQCHDRSSTQVCADPQALSLSARRAALEANCACQAEQHYRYDWDELNRLGEARRYDRQAPAEDWELMVQQRYRYSAANVRMIKETINRGNDGAAFAATTLHPFPGDYERRGLQLDVEDGTYRASTVLGTETQYMVGGARLVWASSDPRNPESPSLTREQRLTLPLTDLVQSTAAVVDLQSGDLLEHTTFYPNGARETHRTTDEVSMQLEPIGFTGKEADEEVGLVYFGERYLIPRLGRWASVDPLSAHAMGGGEAMNGFHYVSGNLLQARDPLGLNTCGVDMSCESGDSANPEATASQADGSAVDTTAQDAEETRQEDRRRAWDYQQQHHYMRTSPGGHPSPVTPLAEPPEAHDDLDSDGLPDQYPAPGVERPPPPYDDSQDPLPDSGGPTAVEPPEDDDEWHLPDLSFGVSFNLNLTIPNYSINESLNVQSVGAPREQGGSGLYRVDPVLHTDMEAIGGAASASSSFNVAIGGHGATWSGVFHNFNIAGVVTFFWGDGTLSSDNPGYFGVDIGMPSMTRSRGFSLFSRYDTNYVPLVTTPPAEEVDNLDPSTWFDVSE